MPPQNLKNIQTNAVAGDLGIAALLNPDVIKDVQDKKQADLATQMNNSINGILGGAANELFGQK